MDIRIKIENPSESVRGLVKGLVGDLLTERVNITVNDEGAENCCGACHGSNHTPEDWLHVEEIRKGLNLVETLRRGLDAQGFSSKMPKKPEKVIDDALNDVFENLSTAEREAIQHIACDPQFIKASLVLQSIHDAIAKKVAGR